MQAIVVEALGEPEVLILRDHPRPAPGSGQVLVRVHAVGVNFSDTERRRGSYDPPPLPYIPGNEAAGVVEQVGPGVDSSWVGRRVAFWAMRTSGAYAQYTAVPVESLFVLRDGISFDQGAALPTQGLTAYALAEVVTSLQSGQSALVHAAAGGVGLLLVQLLQRRGVRVFGTASSDSKRTLLQAQGVEAYAYGDDLVANLQQATGGRGVNAVFDSLGRETRAASLAALAAYGHLVYFGEATGAPAPIEVDELYARSLKVSAFWMNTDPPERWAAAREDLQHWVLTGSLQLTFGPGYALAEAAAAHRALESRATSGKILLRPTI